MLKNSFKFALAGCALLGCWAMTPAVRADETLAFLKVGAETYTNVTVTSITATDIYFSHTRGMGNAKLKNLEPELQKRFRFDPAKASEVEKNQYEAGARFREEWSNRKPVASSTAIDPDDDKDIVVPKVYARSFVGQRPPQIIVETWLTPPPEVKDKFVLVEFWRSSAEPCIQVIPHLNELFARYSGQLVVMSLTDDLQEDVLKVNPTMKYYVGIDLQGRTMKAMEIVGIPHSILIDPKGIVRFEGPPGYLDEKGLKRLMEKYQ